jgi:hypothetical protein
LATSFISLTAKWYIQLSNSQTTRAKKLRLCLFTASVILLAFSDRLLSGELPSDVDPTVIHVHIEGEEHIIQEAQKLISSHGSFKLTRESLQQHIEENEGFFTFLSLQSRKNVNETELEKILRAEISTGNFIVMTGISKKGKTTHTRHSDVIIRLENVKCGACFDSAKRIMNNEFDVIDQQYELEQKTALFHINTGKARQQVISQIDLAVKNNGKKFSVLKVVGGLNNDAQPIAGM